MAVAIVLFILAMAAATFIENDYGTATAKAMVYNAKWFELLMLLMLINFIGNIFKYNLLRKEKWTGLLLHTAFIVTLLGSFITRYYGFEGVMPIREGAQTSTLYSDKSYINARIDNGDVLKVYESEVLFSQLGRNKYFLSDDFGRNEDEKTPFNIELIDYKSRAKESPHFLSFRIQSGDKVQEVEIRSGSNSISRSKQVSLNGLNFTLSYGSKVLKTPFALKLRDFELERYPGTNSASSYASEVTVIDEEKNNSFDYRIFMNHVLDYRGYRFFQASYDQDERGTVLSVNHDYWGTLVTYIGYFLMGIGMFFNLFWKSSRFQQLSTQMKELSAKRAVMILLLMSLGFMGWAQDLGDLSENAVSKEHADKFGKLLIQDHQGRIKPVNTYALEMLRKIYKKDTYQGLSAEQVLLSSQLNPQYWNTQSLVKVKPNALGKKLTRSLKIDGEYAPMINFFPDGNYYLQQMVGESFRKKKALRNATDNEIINLDERINIWWNVMRGSLMNIYPKKGDPNKKWYTGQDQHAFVGQDTAVLTLHKLYLSALYQGMDTGDYSEADEYLGYIADYQKQISPEIIPSDAKVNWEIKYNRWNIFMKVMMFYMLIGFVFLAFAFIKLFRPKSRAIDILLKVCTALTLFGMVAHVFGIGLRWYISGHEPWSNGYEAVIFVAFVTTLAGLIFSIGKSKITLASTVIFSSFLLGIAHGSLMNPEITNLVPVLKSYWLMIHVAVITSSYGFLGLGALLGFSVLFLYILRNKENAGKINDTIDELTRINEQTLTVGLYTLSIGTFLGGVWANESWGRYWSWDPKEVWSLISMMVYVFVLHMRLVPGLRGRFAFNMTSLFAISTLIMTFFGVNFYLSGMHSYAAGDPVPMPTWIYIVVVFFVLFSLFAWYRFKKYKMEVGNNL